MKRKILFVIPVSEETYVKWKIKKERLKDLAFPIATGSLIGMSIGGYIGALKNQADIRKIEKELVGMDNRMDMEDARIGDLERQNNLLFEKALTMTKGEDQ